jgi:hypothetical protein
MHYRQLIIFVLVPFFFASPSKAEEEYKIYTDPATQDRYFTFMSSKGNVRFNHGRHQTRMKAENCLPCHRTETPTKEHTMTRFDKRGAHSFCKGCHRLRGRGPVECHECHKESK